MRTFQLSICFTLAIATVLVSDAEAQQVSRRQSVRKSEQAARASWQPTRPASHQRESERDETRQRNGAPNRLRRVDHITVEGVPVPPPDTPSIVEPGAPNQSAPAASGPIHPGPIHPGPSHPGPIHPGPIHPGPAPVYSAPLDGQIHLAPLHDGSVACDALPEGQCGCGNLDCLGDCNSSCDSFAGCGGHGSCTTAGCSTCGELCSPTAWRPCVTLCVPQDGWVTFEYLGWWQDGMNLPPLVTTSVDPNVPRNQAGVLTSPSTRVLFGGGEVLDEGIDGGRLRFGFWLDRCHTWAVGAEFFQIGRESESFAATSTGDPILARPFFNTESGLEDAELVAFPGVVSGMVGAVAESEFSGGGVHFRHLNCCNEGCSKWLFCGCPEHFCSRTESTWGYRYLELQESVQVTENLVSTDTANPGTFDILDRFDTRNQFNGFDIGWMHRRTRGFWTADCLVRLAIGNTKQTVTINGRTTINDPTSTPAVQTFPGGLLTQTSNIGVYRQDEFTVVPEFNANIGYQLTDHLRMMLGYTFIYWSNVARPGEQISRDLNPNLLPPPAEPFTGAQRPSFAFDTTDYWAQGINFGGEFRW